MAKKAPAAKTEEVVKAGAFVTFLGYGDDVKEEERVLEQDKDYEVLETTDNGYVVKFENPDFDSKKKEDPEKNPKTLETEVFTSEVKLSETQPEVASAKAAPATTKVKGGKAVKGKAEKAPKEVKAKAPKAPKEPKPPKEVVDDLPDLSADQEDPDVLAIVDESEDLVATAQDLEGNIGKNEYHLGGVLYHIKKSKSYQDLNPAYKENLGWANFLKDYMNIDYRKAMNLIDIYVTFSTLGIENPAEQVAKIGWTKASKITSPMREDGANPDELLTLASENTVADLVTSIKEQKVEVGGTKGEMKKRITMKFRFFEEEGTGLVAIIQKAKQDHGLTDDDAALAFILEDWASSQGGGEAKDAPQQSAAPVGTKATAKPTPRKGAASANAAAA